MDASKKEMRQENNSKEIKSRSLTSQLDPFTRLDFSRFAVKKFATTFQKILFKSTSQIREKYLPVPSINYLGKDLSQSLLSNLTFLLRLD